jgi:hypothetical protein
MPLPVAYAHEADLAQELHVRLGRLTTILGWKVEEDSYRDILSDTLEVLGVDLISDLTTQEELRKLRAVALWKLWEYVVDSLVANYRFSSDFQTFERQQIYDHAEKSLKRAMARASSMGITVPGGLGVMRVPIRDPYQVSATSSNEFGA